MEGHLHFHVWIFVNLANNTKSTFVKTYLPCTKANSIPAQPGCQVIFIGRYWCTEGPTPVLNSNSINTNPAMIKAVSWLKPDYVLMDLPDLQQGVYNSIPCTGFGFIQYLQCIQQ